MTLYVVANRVYDEVTFMQMRFKSRGVVRILEVESETEIDFFTCMKNLKTCKDRNTKLEITMSDGEYDNIIDFNKRYNDIVSDVNRENICAYDDNSIKLSIFNAGVDKDRFKYILMSKRIYFLKLSQDLEYLKSYFRISNIRLESTLKNVRYRINGVYTKAPENILECYRRAYEEVNLEKRNKRKTQ